MSSPLPHPITHGLFVSPVPPGTGWPDDQADASTPSARSRTDVERLSKGADLAGVTARSSVCAACPRLVEWREKVAVEKRSSFAEQPYWGRPAPGWGDPRPGVLVLGLAPAANGANRTGRVFTGDRSGNWLYAALCRAGLATQPTATHAGDGLELRGARIIAAVRCAPPANKPTPEERDTCAIWLNREVELVLPYVRCVVTLGSFAWTAALKTLGACGLTVPRPAPKFAHGAETEIGGVMVLGSYHPSQQNTFTGKLTEKMLDAIFTRAKRFVG